MRPKTASKKSRFSKIRVSGFHFGSGDGVLDRVADGAILGIIFLAPWFMGGRHDLGRLVYVSMVAVLALAWFAKQYLAERAEWYRIRGSWILGLGLGLVCLQLIPLAPETLHAIAPAQESLLPLWQAHEGQSAVISEWQQISLAPRNTKLGLIVFWAHLCLFLIVIQRMRNIEAIERHLRWVALGALSMAALGFVQYVSRTENFGWFFRHPTRDAHWFACGPFANSNHFAHFLALGIGPLIWWLQSLSVNKSAGPTGNRFYNSNHRERDLFAILMIFFAFAVLVVSGFLSQSRGGIVIMGLATLISLVLFWLAGRVGRWTLLGLCCVAAIVMTGVFFHGTDGLSGELGSLVSGSLDELDSTHGRRRVWAANLEAAKMFPLLGAGVGAHGEIYHKFFPYRSHVEFTHAESSFLNLLTETGFVGLGLALLAVVYCLGWSFVALFRADSARAGTCGIAVTTSLVVSVTHSLWDFVWYIGGCMSLTIVIAACAYRLAADHRRGDQQSQKTRQISSHSWLLGGIAVAAVSICFLCIQLGPALAAPYWNKYRRLSLSSSANLEDVYANKGVATDADLLSKRYGQLRQMHECLTQVLRYDPSHFRAHQRVASILSNSFDLLQMHNANAMSYVQIRDAVWASNFSNLAQQRAWLDVAVGGNSQLLDAAVAHSIRGLHGCPLQGRGYLSWGELAFLQGADREFTFDLLQQAELVRPHDGAVLFGAGRELLFIGQPVAGLERWRRAFHLDEDYRNQVIQHLAHRMPAAGFVQLFEPNPQELEALFHFYRVRNATADVRVVAPMLAQHLGQLASQQEGTKATRTWLKCVDVYRSVEDGPAAIRAAEHAVEACPNDFDSRVTLAHQLTKEQRFDEAEAHWLWCARRHPNDTGIARQLARIQEVRNSSARAVKQDVAAPAESTSVY